MENNPLVSVGVLTYNSAKYIIEALESVKNQSYQNIELIVSDDYSKDNTVEICRKWIDENKNRFVNAELITVEKNTGTSANCNRQLAACKGEWLKQLAGDDAMFPDCVENFIDFICKNPEAQCVVGNVREYRHTFDEKNVIDVHSMHFKNNDIILEKTAEEQLHKFKYGNTFIPPAVFINVNLMRKLGGYDEKYGILEDEPFYMKMLQSGYKIFGMNKDVVKYRTSDTNVWGNSEKLFNFTHQKLHYQWLKDMCFPYYTMRERLRSRLYFAKYRIMYALGLTKKNKFNRTVEVMLFFLFAIITMDFSMVKGYISKILKL